MGPSTTVWGLQSRTPREQEWRVLRWATWIFIEAVRPLVSPPHPTGPRSEGCSSADPSQRGPGPRPPAHQLLCSALPFPPKGRCHNPNGQQGLELQRSRPNGGSENRNSDATFKHSTFCFAGNLSCGVTWPHLQKLGAEGADLGFLGSVSACQGPPLSFSGHADLSPTHQAL